MATKDQIDQLVLKLLKLEQDNKLKWKETTDTRAFLINVGKYAIVVRKSLTASQAYRITLLDENGKEIDKYTYDPKHSLYGDVRNLWEIARRKALNIEMSIDKILQELELLDNK